MIKIVYFLVLTLYLLGVIGGIGYTVYTNAYVITLGIVVTSYLAFPKAKELFKKMLQ